MLIDAHQHFWRIGCNGQSWPTPDLSAIHRDFLPADLRMAAAGTGLIGCVAVQSQPSDLDTDWLLDLADGDPMIRGVVGWVDLASAAAPARIEALAARPKFRGLRPMLQALPDDDWIVKAALDPAVEAMSAHGLTLDALVFTRHLPFLAAFADRWPELPIVIDHAAKPPIASTPEGAGSGTSETIEAWRREIARVAERPNVFCKLSGLLTEARADQAEAALEPFVRHLVETFGYGRLMWGSDWPVLNLAGNFADWHRMAEHLTGSTQAGDLQRLFGETAQTFYRL